MTPMRDETYRWQDDAGLSELATQLQLVRPLLTAVDIKKAYPNTSRAKLWATFGKDVMRFQND